MSLFPRKTGSRALTAFFLAFAGFAGCASNQTPGPSAGPGADSTPPDGERRFDLLEGSPALGVGGTPSEDRPPSAERILADLAQGRRFVESIQDASPQAIEDAGVAGTLESDSGALTETVAVGAVVVASSEPEVAETAPSSAPIEQLVQIPGPGTTGADPSPLTPMIRFLMDQASTSDAPLKQHLALAVLFAWVAPDRAFAPEGLAELTEDERRLVEVVYRRFKDLGPELEDGGDAAALSQALSRVIEEIDAADPFRISRISLCSSVRDFGDVDVFDPPMFSPSERPRFIWYVELDGVQADEDSATGEFGHEFDVRIEMLSRDTGVPVVPPAEHTVDYTSSSRRRDVFVRNVFEIPPTLKYGWYTVKVTVNEPRLGTQSQMGMDLLWTHSLAAGTKHFDRNLTSAVPD